MGEDVIALHDEPAPPGAQPLLAEVLRGGARTREESLEEARARCRDRVASLPPPQRDITRAAYPVRLSAKLEALRRAMASDQAGA